MTDTKRERATEKSEQSRKASDRPEAQTSDEDFTRNKNGLYGGVPKVRDSAAPGEAPVGSNPAAKRTHK